MSQSAPPRIVVRLIDEVIDSDEIWSALADIDAGAHSLFLGKTRRRTEDQQTRFLLYEAYRPMALAQLQRLADEATQRWSLKNLVLIHRLGRVEVGEASIAVGASAGHRKDVFAAIPWLMDEIKSSVPIWKQENWIDGTHRWVHP